MVHICDLLLVDRESGGKSKAAGQDPYSNVGRLFELPLLLLLQQQLLLSAQRPPPIWPLHIQRRHTTSWKVREWGARVAKK